MASLAASIAGNMASAGVALSGLASNTNTAGSSLGTLQQNVQRAAVAIGSDVRNIATATASAATAEKAKLEDVVRAFTAAAVASETAKTTLQTGLSGSTALVSGVVSQIPTLKTLLGAFLGLAAAKLVFDSVSASIAAAREHLEDFVKIGRDAERAGVGTDFFQRATLAADKYGLKVDQVAEALKHARTASEVVLGEGKDAKNAAPIDGRLEQNVRAGNLAPADRAAFNAAGSQEAKIRVVLDLIDKLRASARDAAAFDLAGKFFGPDFERQLRSGIDLTGKLREAINSTSTTVAGVRIIAPDEIERANKLDAKAKDIADTLASALAPITKDISTAVIDTYDGFLKIQATIVSVVEVAAKLYAQMQSIVGSTRELVGSIPYIGKVLTAGNVITFAGEYIEAGKKALRAAGIIDPEVQGPEAPLTLKVKPKGSANARPLPSLHAKGGGDTTESLDAVETLINQIQKAADTSRAELENVEKTNVERERAVALAKAEAAAREDFQKGKRTDPALDDDERTRVLAAATSWQTYKDRVMDAQQALRQTADQARYFGQIASDSLSDAILEGRSFSDVLGSIQKQIARAALQAAFTGQGPLAGLLGTATKASEGSDAVGGLAGLVSSGFGSFFRANGGPVEAGRGYTVGEMGRELFVPSTNGQIVPLRQGAGTGGGAAPVNVYNYAGGQVEATPQRRSDGGVDLVIREAERGLGGRGRAGQGPLAPFLNTAASRKG